MKKTMMISLIGAMMLLCFGILARGQTVNPIPINGPTTVCVGSLHLYDVTPTAGNNYLWSTTSNGSISLTTSSTATIQWGIAGTGWVRVYGVNIQGDTTEIDSLEITVMPLPEPMITTDNKVACQSLTNPTDDEVPQFDSGVCDKVCAYSTVTYTATGDPGSTFTWTAVGGTVTPTNGNPVTVTWGGPGYGSLTVTETTADGCEGIKTICIDIIESPIAHFVALPDTSLNSITVCDGSAIIFLDKSYAPSTSPIVTWLWDFGDGSYSNAQGSLSSPVTHTYAGPGSYTVTLTVTNACGCSTSTTMEVNVDPQTGVKISCPGVVCENDVQAYTVDVPCSASSWSVVGGTFIPPAPTAGLAYIRWDNVGPDGFGYVMYDPSSCPGVCPSTAVAKIPVILANGTIEGKTVVCPGSQYIYKLPQWPSTTFAWSLGTGTGTGTLSNTDQPNEIVLTTGNPGTITLYCHYTNTILGCSGTATLNINIEDPERIVGPDKVCISNGTVFTIYHLSGGNLGDWTFTPPSHIPINSYSTSSFPASDFPVPGVYKLEVTGTGFCPPDPFYITVDPPPPTPTSIEGPDVICKGVPVKYAGQNPMSSSVFGWWVQNGTANSTVGDESHIKLNTTSSGPFVIHMWREGKEAPFCHSDTITKVVTTPVVVVGITGDVTPCKDSYFPYEATYKDGESYKWSILDEKKGSVVSGDNTPNVSILWNHQPGIAKIVCEVRKCYEVFRDTLEVEIDPPFPGTATFSFPSNICINTTFPCFVFPTNPGVTAVVWDMGDGKIPQSGGTVYNYRYNHDIHLAVDPVYTIKATLINPSGCPGNDLVLSQGITVNRAPWTSITPAQTCKPSLPFTQLLTLGNNSPNPSFVNPPAPVWYRNGVATGTGPTLNANNFGTYYAIATSAAGCSDTSDLAYIVECAPPCTLTGSPTVSITSSNLVACGTIQLTGTYSTGGTTFVGAGWSVENWPNGIKSFSSTTTTADIEFDSAGSYKVYYTATFNDGTNTCERRDSVIVQVPYVPDFEIHPLCDVLGGNRKVQLIYTGTAMAGQSVSYNFAVNSSSYTIGFPYEAYIPAGTQNIGVQVTGSSFTCTLIKPEYIPPMPDANFSFARPITCIKEAAVVFTNTSISASTVLWSFGDQSQNTQYDPERVYDALPQFKQVKLVVRDAYGCLDSITKRVTVIADQIEGKTKGSPNNACEGTPVTLSYLPNGITNYGNLYKWKKDKVVFAQTTTPSTTVFESGYYWAYVEDQYGCFDESDADTVTVMQLPNVSVYGKPDQCVDDVFTLSGYAGNIPGISYQWYLGVNPIPLATQPTLQVTQSTPGTYSYKVEITVPNPAGGSCSKMSDPFVVTVHPTPAKPLPQFAINNCSPYEVELRVNPPAPGTYNWSNGASGNPVVVPNGGPFQVTYTDQYGCESKNALMVPKDPYVYLWIFPSGCYNLCLKPGGYTIQGPIIPFVYWEYLKNGNTHQWGPAYVQPLILPQKASSAGVYNLLLDNGYCTATSADMNVVFLGCDPPPRIGGGDDAGEEQDATDASSLLRIVPNPAQSSTRIDFRLPANGAYTLEVYDVTGRRLSHIVPPATEGSWNLSLDSYTPGVYQVVVRQGQAVIMQKRLTVIK